MKKKIIVASMLWLQAFFCCGMLYAGPGYNARIFLLTAEPLYQFEIIPAPNNTWGYNIQKDHTIFIHQPNRPGVPGNEGFRTQKDAIKVAKLVIAKIKKGIMPPTVSTEELKELKLTN